MNPKLHDYQRYAADFVKQTPRAGLFLDMGLGKTLITLTSLVELAKEGRLFGHILIIAPLAVAKSTWPSEIKKWDISKNANYKVLAGLSKKKREEVLNNVYKAPATIYIINREQVTTIVDYFKDVPWPFPNIVIDELQSFKSHASKRFKSLRSVIPQAQRIIGLTGTPAPNSIMNLWSEITLLDNGYRLGENITTFRNVFFYPGRRTSTGQPYEWFLQEGAETAIYNRISDITISMKSIDYLTMPSLTYNYIPVSMTAKERKVYDTMKKDMVLELSSGDEITASNSAVLFGKLQQLANGALYTEENGTIGLHDHKIEALEQIIDSQQGAPILVFYHFKHDLQRIINHFGDEVTVFDKNNAEEIVNEWNAENIPVLLLHPGSNSEGLNLQEGGHTVVWFAITPSLGHYAQANTRVYRQGQQHPVVIHHIVSENTIDEHVLEILERKRINQDNLLDAIKANVPGHQSVSQPAPVTQTYTDDLDNHVMYEALQLELGGLLNEQNKTDSSD